MNVKVLRGVLVGDYNVGKTSLVRRIFDNKWEASQSTIGVEFRSGVVFDNTKISIWDTGGSERYRSIIPMYFRNVDFIFIVLDKTDPHIHETYLYWKGLMETHANPKTPWRVLVNKRDLDGISEQTFAESIAAGAYHGAAEALTTMPTIEEELHPILPWLDDVHQNFRAASEQALTDCGNFRLSELLSLPDNLRFLRAFCVADGCFELALFVLDAQHALVAVEALKFVSCAHPFEQMHVQK